MAAPPDIRPLVERLLRGDRRTDGLHRIFLWLRAKAPRNSAVRDVGNFVGHRDSRDSGISWERGTEFCHMAAFHLHDRTNPDSLTVEVVRRGIHACYRAFGAAAAKNKFNVGYEKLGTELGRALDKIVGVIGKQLVVREAFTERETAIMKYYSERIVVRGALTEEAVISELDDLLRLESALAADESLREQSCFICAYIITQMNGAELIEHGKPIARLSAHARDRMTVQVHYRIGRGNMVADIFTTECDPKAWSTREVQSNWLGQMPPLELDEAGRLTFL